jgi:hypothetical protein
MPLTAGLPSAADAPLQRSELAKSAKNGHGNEVHYAPKQ